MPVKLSTSPVRLTALLSGELDHHSAPALRAETDRALLCTTARMLRLDFERVSFMDSSGVGFVMGRYRLAKSKGMSVEVTGLNKKYLTIMKMSGLQNLVSLQEVKNK